MSIEIRKAKYGMRWRKQEIEETIKSLEASSVLFGILGGRDSQKKREKIALEIKELEIELSEITIIVGTNF